MLQKNLLNTTMIRNQIWTSVREGEKKKYKYHLCWQYSIPETPRKLLHLTWSGIVPQPI
jgi:hypothetical protein